MKRTIDEHIEQLKKLKSFHNGSYGASVNFAIDIIRKYQKIEQILKNIPYGGEATVRRIQEVVEDAKID